jgi:HemY protein
MERFLRSFGFFIKFAIIAAIALWVYLNPGQIQLEWQGYLITTSFGFAAIVLAIAVLMFATLYHHWRNLLSMPRKWRRHRQVKAMEQGYQALNKGLLAVAGGDAQTAAKQSKKALGFLPDNALSHLLAAQTAQLRNDDVTADTHLAKLMLHPDGQLFALRGQLTRALAREDRTEALRLARLAYSQQSNQPWIVDTTVQMEARAQNWIQAEKILRQAIKLNDDNEPRWQKDLSAVLVCLSDAARIKNDMDAALECAREAAKRHPGWSPAVIRLADLWQRKTYRRRAQKILMTAWESDPHPDLVAAWLHATGTERATDNTTTIEKLVSVNPDNAESAMAMAQAFTQAGLWGVARQHALRAVEYAPTRAAYRLLADIERGDSNNPNKIAMWLDKAADAQAEEQWVCQVTQDIFPAWQALNRQSHFNTIQWAVPVPLAPGSSNTVSQLTFIS